MITSHTILLLLLASSCTTREDHEANLDEDGDGYQRGADDCDDGDAEVYPGASERCNGEDDDCDGVLDNGLQQQTFYLDMDGDGYGISSTTSAACAKPLGYAIMDDDCDDNDDHVHPGAPEVCDDGEDNNCDGEADEPGATCEPTLACSQGSACTEYGSCACTCGDGSALHWDSHYCSSPDCGLEGGVIGISNALASSGGLTCGDELMGLDDSLWPEDGLLEIPTTLQIEANCAEYSPLWQWYNDVAYGNGEPEGLMLWWFDSRNEILMTWLMEDAVPIYYTPPFPCSGTITIGIVANYIQVERPRNNAHDKPGLSVYSKLKNKVRGAPRPSPPPRGIWTG